jgi:hypothetical protein
MDGMIRWGAWCGVAGGALRVVTTFLPWQPGSAGIEAVYAATDLSLLFATIAAGLVPGLGFVAAGIEMAVFLRKH